MRDPAQKEKIVNFMESLGRCIRQQGRVYVTGGGSAVMYGKLPGEDLIEEGLRDLSKNHLSTAALLVLIGAPRLRRMGLVIPKHDLSLHPEHSLYERLWRVNPKNAHSSYNALIRRLVSYERSLERGGTSGPKRPCSLLFEF